MSGHASGPSDPTAADLVTAIAPVLGGDPGLLARLHAIYTRDFDAVVPDSGPAVFAHNDLHPGNILAQERDGRLELSGLIDFDNACSSSAVMDLAKATLNSEHMAPGCTAAILAGYGPIDHPRPAEALAFYTLLHRVSMWAWLRQIRVLPTPDAPSDISEALLATADG